MKLLRRSAALALIVLLLAGCSAKTSPSPSETPTPSETPPAVESPTSYRVTPAPEGLTAEEELLYYLDIVLDGEEVKLMCWLTQGSGPTGADLAPYKEEVRALFAELEWSYRGDRDTAVHEYSPADWGYYLQAGNSSVNMVGGTRHDDIDVAYIGLEGGKPLSYFAEGASGLAMKLVDLYPGPHIRFLLAEVPAEGVNSDEELAQAYAAAFEAFYLESGDIIDFELTELDVVKKEDVDSIYRFFRMAFSVTPADPDDPYWATLTPGSDGRYTFDYEMHMLLDEDNTWRCDWFQTSK